MVANGCIPLFEHGCFGRHSGRFPHSTAPAHTHAHSRLCYAGLIGPDPTYPTCSTFTHAYTYRTYTHTYARVPRTCYLTAPQRLCPRTTAHIRFYLLHGSGSLLLPACLRLILPRPPHYLPHPPTLPPFPHTPRLRHTTTTYTLRTPALHRATARTCHYAPVTRLCLFAAAIRSRTLSPPLPSPAPTFTTDGGCL